MDTEKYKWSVTKLQGQIWANGLHPFAIKLHNDLIDALAIECGDTEGFIKEIQKELNEIKKHLSDIEYEYTNK